MNPPVIAVFGANPAWQKTLLFDAFIPGAVNRAKKMDAFASGKGVNFCRASRCLGECETRLFQFAGGGNGKKLTADLDRARFLHTSIGTDGETRVCSTCIDGASGAVTELIEPSCPVPAKSADAMVDAWEKFLPFASGCAITGSLPDGTDPVLYKRIAEKVFCAKLPFLIDAVSGIGGALDENAPFILKINADELKKLVGVSGTLIALKTAADNWRSAVLAVTDGGNDAFLYGNGHLYRYRLPGIKVLNPIGSGDTCAAVLLGRILGGKSCPDAFADALAAASANCLDPQPGNFQLAAARKLLPEITEITFER